MSRALLWPLCAFGLLFTIAAGDAATKPLSIAENDPCIHRDGRRWLLAQAPFSGELVRTEPGGGHTRLPLVDGLLQGTSRGTYPDGARRSEREYRQGEKSGRQREWWPNGQLRFAANMEHDRVIGPLYSWYADGHPFEEKQYIEGQESGLQRVFDDSGELRANYVVRGGRRYGFVLPQACTNAPQGEVFP